MGDYYTAMLSDPMPPVGLKRLDKIKKDREALSGITNPIQSPLHEDALTLEDIKPGLVVELRNKNIKPFATAVISSFPFREDNDPQKPLQATLKTMSPDGDYTFSNVLLSEIGVAPDLEEGLWDANHYTLRAKTQ